MIKKILLTIFSFLSYLASPSASEFPFTLETLLQARPDIRSSLVKTVAIPNVSKQIEDWFEIYKDLPETLQSFYQNAYQEKLFQKTLQGYAYAWNQLLQKNHLGRKKDWEQFLSETTQQFATKTFGLDTFSYTMLRLAILTNPEVNEELAVANGLDSLSYLCINGHQKWKVLENYKRLKAYQVRTYQCSLPAMVFYEAGVLSYEDILKIMLWEKYPLYPIAFPNHLKCNFLAAHRGVFATSVAFMAHDWFHGLCYNYFCQFLGLENWGYFVRNIKQSSVDRPALFLLIHDAPEYIARTLSDHLRCWYNPQEVFRQQENNIVKETVLEKLAENLVNNLIADSCRSHKAPCWPHEDMSSFVRNLLQNYNMKLEHLTILAKDPYQEWIFAEVAIKMPESSVIEIVNFTLHRMGAKLNFFNLYETLNTRYSDKFGGKVDNSLIINESDKWGYEFLDLPAIDFNVFCYTTHLIESGFLKTFYPTKKDFIRALSSNFKLALLPMEVDLD
jgi:hypothetical protein